LLRKEKEYAAEIKRHFSFTIPGMRKEISLFLIAGFFSGAIVQADISPFLVHWLLMFSNASPIGITFFITVFMIITAIMGLHPIIFITIFASSIQPQALGLTPEFFALLLLGSWGISNAISPSTAVNNLLSVLCKTDIMTISIRWNIRYVIVMCILFLLYMMFIKQTFPL
jgi:DcuC family C4-dicarboxylate transporter